MNDLELALGLVQAGHIDGYDRLSALIDSALTELKEETHD